MQYHWLRCCAVQQRYVVSQDPVVADDILQKHRKVHTENFKYKGEITTANYCQWLLQTLQTLQAPHVDELVCCTTKLILVANDCFPHFNTVCDEYEDFKEMVSESGPPLCNVN